MKPQEILPVEVVFHPSWWYKNFGIKFDKNFFFDPETRIESDRCMRQKLFERFPELGLGENRAKSLPVLGGTLIAAGYIISGILGCEIRYFEDAPPEVIPANFSDRQVEKMKVPNIFKTPIMVDLINLIDKLEKQFGYLEGDINWEGVQNVALNLRGQQLFIDYYTDPDLAIKLLDIVYYTIIQFLDFIFAKTGSSSISVNRIVGKVKPDLFLHSNCTISLVSADFYKEFLFHYDKKLSERFYPYGIHYCGNDMEKVREKFAELENVELFDVGWGSDVEKCREVLPDKFLSLRLSPERMKHNTANEIENDINFLLEKAGPIEKTGLCCINMDYGTPENNVRRIFEVAERYRKKLQV